MNNDKICISEIIVPKQGLIFKTEDGKVIAKLIASDYGGTLGIWNNQGKLVAAMGAREDGGSLSIANNQEKLGAWMSADKNGGALDIRDNQEKIIWSKP